ncbi:hypothetical protein CVT24_006489 [Panaeolus cyanescens]|uniref:Uncharacterized protein n=1 Tax=Panaeolus cyanescens TaxID=181874 RepID=A0A409WSW1_9AGAR|nr:hypothetical protein CVT24_006489 [Panaeolus cyanescens]
MRWFLLLARFTETNPIAAASNTRLSDLAQADDLDWDITTDYNFPSIAQTVLNDLPERPAPQAVSTTSPSPLLAPGVPLSSSSNAMSIANLLCDDLPPDGQQKPCSNSAELQDDVLMTDVSEAPTVNTPTIAVAHPTPSSTPKRPRSETDASGHNSKPVQKRTKPHVAQEQSTPPKSGQSRSAKKSKELRQKVKEGTYIPTTAQLTTWREKILKMDPSAKFQQHQTTNHGYRNVPGLAQDAEKAHVVEVMDTMKTWVPEHKLHRIVSTLCKKEALILSNGEPKLCSECQTVFASQAFKNALNKSPPKLETNYKHVPKEFRNKAMGDLYAKHKGLKGIFDAPGDPHIKVAKAFIDGKLKAHGVFGGIVSAMAVELERGERGVGKQNFPYSPEYYEFCQIICDASPQAYE